MEHQELIPHLFRTEFRKITTVLCKLLGIAHLADAEDIAGDTFLAAFENWSYRGIPDNPTAWLYAVAKNKARNYIERNQLYTQKVSGQLKRNLPEWIEPEIDLSDKNISDSELKMLFAICNPVIPTAAQIALALRILCGFGIEEIANAFLTNKETINKRLLRAREKLKKHKIPIELPAKKEINKRLETVLTTLYLLFNEGYYSESNEAVLRNDLCLEAMRLTYLLADHTSTNQPEVNALLSLMCFHASRFEARKNSDGAMVLYRDQDESLWDTGLITKGVYFLHQASKGDTVSKYHIEASIAYWHTIKEDTKEKWENILFLHDQLPLNQITPVTALNRIFALSKIMGKMAGIREAEQLNLTGNHFYFMLLGELFKEIDTHKALTNFQQAYSLAKTKNDKETILRCIEQLSGNN